MGIWQPHLEDVQHAAEVSKIKLFHTTQDSA